MKDMKELGKYGVEMVVVLADLPPFVPAMLLAFLFLTHGNFSLLLKFPWELV